MIDPQRYLSLRKGFPDPQHCADFIEAVNRLSGPYITKTITLQLLTTIAFQYFSALFKEPRCLRRTRVCVNISEDVFNANSVISIDQHTDASFFQNLVSAGTLNMRDAVSFWDNWLINTARHVTREEFTRIVGTTPDVATHDPRVTPSRRSDVLDPLSLEPAWARRNPTLRATPAPVPMPPPPAPVAPCAIPSHPDLPKAPNGPAYSKALRLEKLVAVKNAIHRMRPFQNGALLSVLDGLVEIIEND